MGKDARIILAEQASDTGGPTGPVDSRSSIIGGKWRTPKLH